MNYDKLFAPFSPDEIEWRYADFDQVAQNRDHLIFPFIKATAIRRRLDSVVGVEGWKQKLIPANGGIICNLSIKIGDKWLTKSDAFGDTNLSPIAGAATRAFTRAAAVWGIGRYLYDLPHFFANYVEKDAPGARPLDFNGERFYHIPPDLTEFGQKNPQVVSHPSSPPRPRPQVTGQPRVVIAAPAPLGTKSAVDQAKQSFVPQVKNATSVAREQQQAPAPQPRQQDVRPFANEKIRFGKTKGKKFGDHTEEELASLVRYLTVDLPYPTSKTVIEDKRRLTEFLGGKLEAPKQLG